MILPLDQLRGLPDDDDAPPEAGVYFLWRGPQLNYIGQTINLSLRLDGHVCAQWGLRTGKRIPFNRFTYLLCRDGEQRSIETEYLRAYRPPFNVLIP